jgi:hypothetical protein
MGFGGQSVWSFLSEAVKGVGGFVVALLVISAPVLAISWLFRSEGDSGRQHAPRIVLQCPTEGRFEAPQFILGDVPNPAEGWDVFLEGTPRRIELSPPPTDKSNFRLVTCEIKIGEASVELSTHLPGNRTCHIAPNGGSFTLLQDGSESCLTTDKSNVEEFPSCIVTCE